ncbi:MAG TPA: HNH endonuclease [Gemmataceae bacterium]|nr:HNH endonuclease [Gemmataceae bacterium]
MTDDTIAAFETERNEDYTGACCLLVRRSGPRSRRHLKIEVLIDADRLPDLSMFQWVMWEGNIRSGRHYVACLSPLPGMSGWILPLHRYLVDPPKGMVVDHKNRRPNDNRMRNLRICTHAQNSWNSTPSEGKSSPYKGVCRVGRKRGLKRWWWCKWRASIKKSGKMYVIGMFDKETHAAFAYNLFAERLYGEYAYVNDVVLGDDEVAEVHQAIELLEAKRRLRLLPKPIARPKARSLPVYAMDLVGE